MAASTHLRDIAVVSAALLLASTAGSALAATVTQPPAIVGVPLTGAELTASAGAWSPAGATPFYDWLRCDATGAGCIPLPGSCDRRYTVRNADVGHTLRARLTVSEAGQPPASGVSTPTAAVTPPLYPIQTPGDPGAGCVFVTPTGPAAGTFSSGGATGPGSAPSPDTRLAFIDPFPVVRISGRFKGRRTTLTRVTVRAPRGARIRVRCRGRGCPYRRRAIAVRLVRVRALQRTYRPRATVALRITQRGKIGKYVRIRTRRGRAPTRIDRCLMPGRSRPLRCPTA